MKLLVTILSRQTVVQASIIQEASPDFIFFISTPMAAENGWYEKIPILIKRGAGAEIGYLNVFIEENISLSKFIETVKRHVRILIKKYGVTDLYCDASSGKGIHRIMISEYLKSLSDKKGLDFFLIYFDLDARLINKIAFNKLSFSEYKSSVSIDWRLKERVSLYGAELNAAAAIYDSNDNYFADSQEQFEELYLNLCNSMNLRAFFSSYDNIKSAIDLKSELKNFMVESYLQEQTDKFIQRIFGVMPHIRPEINNAKNSIKAAIADFFKEMRADKRLRSFPASYAFRNAATRYQKRFFSEVNDIAFREIVPFAEKADKAALKSDIAHFSDVLFSKISDKFIAIADVKNIEITDVVFNRFKQKYIKDFERESSLNTRSQISIVFEKIVSYAVFRAIERYPLLKETIASVYQNVKLSGKASSLIEIDTLVIFKNGYLHIFEAKSSHVSNKDLNSRILVMKKYLGESVGMDIVFPFTEGDIAAFEEKDEPFMRKFYSKGLKTVNTWSGFFSTTDKFITPIDKIAERILDLSFKYS